MTIRRVQRADVPAVVGLVHELAAYEREPESCHLTEAQLEAALFADAPALFGHVAEVDGEVVAMALWFLNFSTWRGTHGIHLEDIFVRPDQRGSGLGRRLIATLARECVDRGFERLEWVVLDWNEPARGFYRSIGATEVDEWITNRVTDDALREIAGRAG